MIKLAEKYPQLKIWEEDLNDPDAKQIRFTVRMNKVKHITNADRLYGEFNIAPNFNSVTKKPEKWSLSLYKDIDSNSRGLAITPLSTNNNKQAYNSIENAIKVAIENGVNHFDDKFKFHNMR